MKFLKTYLSLLPECILLLSTLFYLFNSGWTINPIAIVIILVILTQTYFKKQATGIALSLLFVLIFSYLFLALFSDVVKLDSLADGWEMIVFGSAYLGVSLLASIFMLVKYVRMETPSEKITR
jgi:hypothetical protein